MASNYNNPINILDTKNAIGVGSGGSLNVEGGASIKQDTFIGGSLSVSGTSTAFSDNIMIMNKNPTSTKDTGILFERYIYVNEKKYSGLIYNETSDEFIFGYANSDNSGTGITFGNYIPIRANQLLLMSTENSIGLGSGGSLTVLGGASISKTLNVSNLSVISDNNTTLTTTGGNVGIGTSAPSKSLDIIGDINLTGDFYKNGDLYNPGSQWTSFSNNVVYTKGNIGINTTSPNTTLDVNGTANFSSSITTSSVNATNLVSSPSYTGGSMNLSGDLIVGGSVVTVNVTTTNVKDINISTGTINVSNTAYITNATIPNLTVTNISSATLTLSTGLTSASLQTTNANVTTATIATLLNTNAVSTNISSATLTLSTGLTSASAQITNAVSTNITSTNIVVTNSSLGAINASGATIGGSVVPSANITYDLGSSSLRWKDLYLSGNTIHLGNKQLSLVEDAFSIEKINIFSTIDSGSSSSGAVVVNGGVGISKSLNVNGTVSSSLISTDLIKLTNFINSATIETSVNVTRFNDLHYWDGLNDIISTDFTWGPSMNENNPYTKESILNNTNKQLTIKIRFTGQAINIDYNYYYNITGTFYIANSSGTLITTLYEYTVDAPTENGPEGTLLIDSGYITATIPAGGSIRSTDNMTGSPNASLQVNAIVYISTLDDIILNTSDNNGDNASVKLTNAFINNATIGTLKVSSKEIVFGRNAGISNQGGSSIAIGHKAGTTSQGFNSVAMGVDAGNTSQGYLSVAIGNEAGKTSQGNYAVAIGSYAGQTSQHNNSIILNATETYLNSDTASAFYVSPVRNVTQANLLAYDNSSKEVTYFSLSNITSNLVSTNISSGTLTLSTGLTSASAQITNVNVTTSTIATLRNTNAVSTNISSATLTLSTGLTSASAQLTNANVTTSTVATLLTTNAVSTNISSATLTLSTGLTSASAQITNANVTTSTIATLLNTNAVSTNITSATLTLSTGLTSASAQITNANVTTATIGTARVTTSLLATGNSNTIGSIFTTNGNVGIATTSPTTTLDVSGTIRASTSITTGAVYSTNITSTNIVATNISSGTLNLLTGLTSASAQITNANVTASTIATLLNTNAVSTNITSATLTLSTGLTSASAQLTNANVTTSTVATLLNTNAISTNISSAALNLSTGLTSASAQITNANVTTSTVATLLNTNAVSTNISSATLNLSSGLTSSSAQLTNANVTTATIPTLLNTNIISTNISGGTISATTITGSNISLSGDLKVAGTLTTVNITSTNLVNTNVSAGVVVASTLLSATGNSNTIGNIFTTGGNVGVGTTSPGTTLDVSGTIRASTSLTTGAVYSTNITSTNVVATNVSAGTLNLSTGLTSASAQITNANVTTSTVATLLNTNAVSTNISSSTLNLSSGLTSSSAQISNANVTTATVATLLNTNAVSTNISSSTLNLSTSLQATNANVTTATVATLLNTNAISTNITSTNIVSTNSSIGTINALGATMGGNLVPSTNITYDLGSTNLRWKDLYLSGNTIHLGNKQLSLVEDAFSIEKINIFSTIDSSSSSSGALIVNGGVGISKSLNVNGTVSSSLVSSSAFSGSNLMLSTGLTANNAQLTNANVTTATVATLLNTNAVSTNISSATLNLSSGLTSASAQITNENVTTSTIATARVTTSLLAIGNSNTVGAIITTGGNVGIGTASPNNKLHVVGSTSNSGGTIAEFRNPGNAESLQIIDETSSTALPGGILNATGSYGIGVYARSGPVRFFTTAGNLERMRITETGNVGIGTTSPNYTLDVTGSVRLNSTAVQNFVIGSTSGTANHSTYLVSSHGNLEIGIAGGAGSFNNSSIAGDVVIRSSKNLMLQSGQLSPNLYIATSGNIGIGTTAPAYKLQVNGDISFPYGNGIYVGGQTYPKAIESVWQNSQDQLVFYTPGANSNTAKLCLQHNGNVGIGTTAPGTTLDVSGTIRASTSLTTGALYSTNLTSTNVVATNVSAGTLNLSTGLTSANAQLTNANITTSTVATLLNTNAVSTNISSATLNLSTGLTTATARISNLTVTNISSNNITVADNYTVGAIQLGSTINSTTSNINLYGAFTDGYGYIQVGSATNTTSANLRLTRWGTTNATIANFQVYSQTSAFLGGNVGIGTTAPGATLDVSGTIRASTSLTTAYVSPNLLVNNATGNGSTVLALMTPNLTTGGSMTAMFFGQTSGNGNIGQLNFGYYGNNNTQNNMSLTFFGGGGAQMYLSNNGNIGIGTTAPGATLDVSGTIRASGTISATTITGGNLSVSGNIALLQGNRITIALTDNFSYSSNVVPHYGLMWATDVGSADGPMAYLTGYGGIRFFTLGTPRMLINASGNVGIGTTSPSELLTVNGNIRLGAASDSNADYSIKSSGQLTIAANDASTQDAAFTSLSLVSGVSTNQSAITVVGSSTLKYTSFATSNTERMRIDSSGNVGIGTTSPSRKLHVQGDMRIGGSGAVLDFGDDFTTQIFRNATTSEIRFNTSSIERVTITSTGNVGIGTTSPQALLHLHNTSMPKLTLSRYTSNIQGGNLNHGELVWKSLNRGVDSAMIRSTSQAVDGLLGWDDAGRLEFLTSAGPGALTRMVISESGNIGIGTTSPTAALHILESTANNTNPSGIFVDKNGERGALQVWNYNNNTTNLQLSSNMYWNSTGSAVVHNTSGGKAWNLSMGSNQDSLRVARFTSTDTSSTFFTINSAGNVGIGTTAPGSALHVTGLINGTPGNGVSMGVGGDGNSGIQLNSGANGSINSSYIDFGYSGIDYTSRIIHFNNSRSLHFQVNGSGTSSMVMASTGNVGIGTDSPGTTLDVSGTIRASTSLTTGAVYSTNITSTNVVATNISAGTLALSNLNVSNASISNLLTNNQTIIGTLGSFVNLPHLEIYGTSDLVNPLYYFSAYDSNNIGSGFGAYINTAGSIKMSTTSTSWLLGKTSNGFNIIKCDGTVGSTATTDTRFIIATSGNIGIGTTTPAYTLDVNGTGRFAGKLTFTGAVASSGFDTATNDIYAEMRVVRNSTSSIDKDMFIQFGAGANSKLFLYSNNTQTMTLNGGSVGIGTTSPGTTLDVSGTIRASTSLTTGAVYSTNITSTNVVATNLSAGALALSNINVSNATITNLLTSNQSIVGTLGSFINLPNIEMYGTSDLVNPLYFASAYDSNNIGVGFGAYYNTSGLPKMSTTSTSWLLGKTSNGFNIIKCDGTVGSTATTDTRFTIATSGNIGIGTTSPSRKLHVQSDMRIGGSGAVLDFGDDFTTQIYRNATTSEMRFNTNSLGRMTITSSGNVGIGTTGPNPNFKLDVIGAGRFTGALTIATVNPTTFSNQTISASADTPMIFCANRGNIGSFLFTNGDASTSYVSINTANHTLDVTGSGRFTGPGGVGTNGSVLITGQDSYTHSLYVASAASQKRIGLSHNGTVGNIFAFDYGGGGAQNLCLQFAGGNVGIGTTSPTAKLHVDGTARSSRLQVVGTAASFTASPKLELFSSSDLTNPTLSIGAYNSDNTEIAMGGYLNGSGTVTMSSTSSAWSFQRSNQNLTIQAYNGTVGSAGTAVQNAITFRNNGNVGIANSQGSSITSLLCVGGVDAGGNGALHVISAPNTFNGGKSQDGATFKAWNDGNNIIQFYNSAGVIRGNIGGNGASAVTYNTSSDRRLKENVVNMSNSINIVKQMRPVEFTWRSDNRPDYGFIAQEMYDILPNLRPNFTNYSHCECTLENISNGVLCECPDHNHDEPVDKEGNPLYYGLDYGKITPYLTKALQETIAELEKLRQDFEEYKNTHQ